MYKSWRVLNTQPDNSLTFHEAHTETHWRQGSDEACFSQELSLFPCYLQLILKSTQPKRGHSGTKYFACWKHHQYLSSGEHMWEWNLRVLDRWGQGKIQSWIGHNLWTWWNSPGCLAKTPWANLNSWWVWFLECWVCWWPTENKMEMPELLAQHQRRGQTPPDGKLLKWT